MADFRKWFLVLAVVALFMGSAVSANAAAFQCTANAGVPPQLRAEGLTELVGDLLLNCTGDVPGGGITANVRIFLNTNVTSRLLDASDGSEALLIIDEPCTTGNPCPPETQRYQGHGTVWTPPVVPGVPVPPNIFQGTQTGVNTIDWLGVPIVAPGSLGVDRVYRITNVRANANQLGTSSSLIPTQVFMYISISGTTSVPVNNPQQVVGFIVPGLIFSTEGVTFRQCEEPQEPIILSFKEGFGTAFKVEGVAQPIPGVVYNTESGLDPDGAESGTGIADNGTRFRIKLVNIPSGISLSVPVTVTGSSPTGQVLRLLKGFDDDGSGGSNATSGAVSVSGGVALIVYEVQGVGTQITVSSSHIETYDVELSVVYESSLPGLTTTPVRVTAQFAPVSDVTVASDVDPIPRFADVGEDKDAFEINACRTILLFPYVTNIGAGSTAWDTGMAISNTSSDPWGTSPQAGACKIYYYGNYPATGAPAPPPVTTPVVESGEQVAWVVSTGGAVVGTTKTCTGCATPGFHGYVIAICDFQYGHGFAYVSDQGAQRVSEAYLALIIPDRSERMPQAFSLGASGNEGEQLVH